MLRVAIVEDEPASARQLEDYLARYQTESGEGVEAIHFPDGAALLQEYRPIWDLILMDIEMPRMDGMTAARHIRERDPVVLLMFITNMAQYAIRGYEVEALDYVLKPVGYAAFAFKMRKVSSILRRRRSSGVVLHLAGGVRRVPTDELLYVETVSHRLHIHTADGVFTMPGTLRDMEEQLAGEHFVRCNKCYLVNLRHVREVRQNIVQVGGEELLISRPRKKEFLQELTDYLGGGGL